MNRGKSQFRRLLELDAQIRSGRYPNCLTFAQEWEVSQKTVQRDIEFLRDSMNAPLAYDRAKKGYYYEDENWFLPSLALTEGELVALLLAAREAKQYSGSPIGPQLQTLMGKLAELLPEKISIAPELVYSRFSFVGPPFRQVPEGTWTVVVRGLLGQRVLEFNYRAFGAERARKWTFYPLHLANLQGEWYLFGTYKVGGDVLQLALTRMKEVRLGTARFTWPKGFDPEKVLSATFFRFAGMQKTHAVRLLFDASVAEWIAERTWHEGQKVKVRRGGHVELSFKAKGLFEVGRWVLSWGRNCTVLAPQELKDEVRGEIRAMARKC